MTDTDPRCPYCDEVLTMHFKGEEFDAPYELRCENYPPGCSIILKIDGKSKADCIRQATNLKLLDRKVREAVDAALDECIADIRARCTACDDGHSGDRETDGTSIECMYCGIPIRHIRARKDASRRQSVDKSGAEHE